MKTLAAMFRYCVAPEAKAGDGPKDLDRRKAQREQLHRFLQISVATWTRRTTRRPTGRATGGIRTPALKLPGEGESGMKLIRRSMAHLARQRLGERDWIEGQIMLGHRKTSTSDTYAPFEIGYLARALEVTEAIISEIEKQVPGAFGPPYSILKKESGGHADQ